MQRAPLFLTHLIASTIFVLASFSAIAADTTLNKVVVMTSYPEEVVSRFEAGFEKAHPGTRVEILWRNSADTRTYLRKQTQQNVDVYWAPAQRNFRTLAREGAFRKLDIDMKGLPDKVGGFPISDPSGYYAATEIAGYGLAYNPQRLKEKGLPQPQQWAELSDPKWQDEIVFPIPSKVGFAPPLIEIILQGYGWDRGWEILQGIGSNAQLLNQGGQHISEEVSSGRASVGASIDFFIQAAITNGAPIRFTYPGITGYSPAHVAVMKNAPHLNNARAFAAYVLSTEGQKILFHPDIRKLPVRPAVYENKPTNYFDPFKAASAMPFIFNTELALHRQTLNNALFDILITHDQATLRRMLSKVNQAEALANTGSSSKLKAYAQLARKLASSPPLSEMQAEAIAGSFLAPFDDISSSQETSHVAILTEWTASIRHNREQAERIAQEVINASTADK